MISLYHPRDWYGTSNKNETTKHKGAIRKSVSQEATNAQCGNQGSEGATFEIITLGIPRCPEAVSNNGRSSEKSSGRSL